MVFFPLRIGGQLSVLPFALAIVCLAVVTSGVAAEASKKLPAWVSEDCTKRDGNYFFVGYGEGQNSATASRNALISSRQNALTCLFGGTITSRISIREDNETLEFDSITDLELDYSYVNWGGYQKVSDRSHALNDARTKVYVQYQWSSVAISAEKDRLDKLASKIAETKAQGREIKVQSRVINQQRQQLKILDRQASELAALKTESERAVARLQQINENRAKEQASISNVISNLYCGITIDELSAVFRKPDSITVGDTNGSAVWRIDINWGDYQVRVNFTQRGLLIPDYEQRKTSFFRANKAKTLRQLGAYKINFIYAENGLTGKGFNLCEK